MYLPVRKFTVKELIAKLQTFNPDADVWMTIRNNAGAYTYAKVDYVNEYRFDELSQDFFGTPGHTDDRVFTVNNDTDSIVVIDSAFEHITIS